MSNAIFVNIDKFGMDISQQLQDYKYALIEACWVNGYPMSCVPQKIPFLLEVHVLVYKILMLSLLHNFISKKVIWYIDEHDIKLYFWAKVFLMH